MTRLLLAIVVAVATFTARFCQECPPPFQQYDVGCYYFNQSIKVNWWKAVETCAEMGGILAMPETKHEVDFIRKKIREEIKLNTWLGGNDLGDEGNWVWRYRYRRILYTPWSRGQPDNYRRRQDCLLLNWTMDYGWTDDFCNVKATVVCQKYSLMGVCSPPETARMPVPTRRRRHAHLSEDRCNVCPPRYQLLASGCYYFSGKVKKTWQKARDTCKAVKGYLAEVGTARAHFSVVEFIANHEPDIPHWLGGSDNETKNSWVWNRKSVPFPYSGWDSKENKSQGHCVSTNGMMTRNWKATDCNIKKAFVCALE